MANKPYNILVAEETKDGKTYWHTIGAAWPAKEGDGFDCKLKSLPLGNSFIIRAPREENSDAPEAESQAE